ncbi:hypothetical protein K523DRAFT_422300, partial [Schizophyllum commune Tattone D]
MYRRPRIMHRRRRVRAGQVRLRADWAEQVCRRADWAEQVRLRADWVEQVRRRASGIEFASVRIGQVCGGRGRGWVALLASSSPNLPHLPLPPPTSLSLFLSFPLPHSPFPFSLSPSTGANPLPRSRPARWGEGGRLYACDGRGREEREERTTG